MKVETVEAAEHVGTAAEASGDAAAEAPACPSCKETLVGDYCHRCGEKRPGARDLTLRHFFAEAAQEFTSVEHSKIFRTLRALLFRPGFLTLEWVAGRRNFYLKPLNLCLIILALQVFVYSTKQVSTFDFGRIVDTERQFIEAQGLKHEPVYERLVRTVMSQRGLSREAVLESINDRWSRNVSFFQLPLVLAYALLLQLFYLFSRRHFVEHVVFSLHFIAFTSLTVVLMWPIYYVLGVTPTAFNVWVAVGKFLLDIVYLFVAARAFYRDTAGWALVKAPAMFAAYFVIYVITYIAALLVSIAAVAKFN
jgi:Protein of unknown function (DUF3667)